MTIAIIGIIYTEFDQSSYKSVYVVIEDEKVKLFETGDPVVDMKDALEHIRSNPIEREIFFSSSFDHFLSDGGAYHWDKYNLIMKNEETV